MAPRQTIINLIDDDLQRLMDEAAAKGDDSRLVTIFGEQFEISTDVNSWLMMKMIGGDMGAVVGLMQSVIKKKADAPGLTAKQLEAAEEADRDNLRRLDDVLSKQRHLSPEVLIGMLGKMLGIVAERPTKSPSDSSSGVKRAGVSRRSAVDG